MYRIKNEQEHEIDIFKSKFICYLTRTLDEESAKAYIEKIRKLHPDATHHCYAFIIGDHNDIQRSNDDGEPGGTAGVPILECLTKNQMQDITAVVVRYFGGVELGKGGLIRAYTKSVSEALKVSVLTKKQMMKKYQITFGIELTGKLDYYFLTHDIAIIEKQFQEAVTYSYLVEKDNSEELSEQTSGKYLPVYLEKVIAEIEVPE